jgi:prepilin-type N-terminal cleavage/methylation domain-containing protein
MRMRGFTLIELLIVVAIIAILAAIAVPNFLEAQTRAKVSREKADMRSLTTAIESYYIDNNQYPPIFVMTAWMPVAGRGPSVFGAPGGPDGNAVSARFIPLTTPIAYITSVLPEAFAVNAIAAAGAVSGDQPGYYDTFDFIIAKEFLPGGPIGGTRGSGLTSGGAWRLAGVGPDRIQAYGGREEAAGATNDANAKGCDYDPTNGTISTGDIVRVGSTAPGEPPFYDRLGVYAQ